MKRLWMLGLLLLSTALLTQFSAVSDLIQCPDGVCDGTANNDVINGTPNMNDIDGDLGDDIIFGGDGFDAIDGEEGNDILFGGSASDVIDGSEGEDVILGGPDDAFLPQLLSGGPGNDVFNVLVSETVNCLLINSDGIGGRDTVNLLGFGPYSLDVPFGQPGFGIGYIIVQDPVALGYIFMHVEDPVVEGTIQRINGLVNPNVTILIEADADTFFNANCTGDL